MARTCDGKRFVGNTRKMEVHDLNNEQRNCQIDEIVSVECLSTLSEARSKGYDNCAYCLGNSTR